MVIINKKLSQIIPSINLNSNLQGKLLHNKPINHIFTIILLPINLRFFRKIQLMNFPQSLIHLISNTIFRSKMASKKNPNIFRIEIDMEITLLNLRSFMTKNIKWIINIEIIKLHHLTSNRDSSRKGIFNLLWENKNSLKDQQLRIMIILLSIKQEKNMKIELNLSILTKTLSL
jgi:hypothetical protein